MPNLSLTATGVTIRNRATGDAYAIHDSDLTYLRDLAPDAWDPFDGDYVVIGPIFGEFSCGMGHNCTAPAN